MLYGEECVSIFTRCQMCKSKLKEAKILLCGVYCENCVTQITRNADKITRVFDCVSCRRIHQIPEDGFMRWDALDEFYSKELPLEDIYRGESAERLKKSLNEIRNCIEGLSFSIATSVDEIREYCLNLRNQVALETELVIKQLQDLSDELINDINNYEAKCIANIESDELNKEKFNNLLNEMKFFHREWSEYLKKHQLQEVDIAKANEKANELEKKFLKEKVYLDRLILRNKSLSYRKSDSKIDHDFLGYLELKTVIAIDIGKLQLLKLKDILPNFNDSLDTHDFAAFETKKIAIVYPNTSDMISIAIIDKTQMIWKLSNLEYGIGEPQMKLKSINGNLIFYFKYLNKLHFLEKLNSNLQLIQSKRIDSQILSIDANETNIYCLANSLENKILVFDHDLVNIKSIGQYEDPEQAFYFTNEIKRVCHRNNTFFILYNEKLDIINEKTGFVLKSISIDGDRITVDSNNNLLVLSVSSSNIFVYNLDGVLEDEIELENVQNGIEFSIDNEGEFVFFNRNRQSNSRNVAYLETEIIEESKSE